MAAQSIRCPGCGAQSSTSAHDHELRTCSYCGTQYVPGSLSGGEVHGRAKSLPRTGARLALGLGAAIASIAVLGAVSGYVLTRPSATPRIASPQPRTANSVERNERSSVEPAEADEPEVPATATFEFDGTRPSVKTSVYALGWVTNTSPFTIDKPAVNAVLLDKQGQELGLFKGFAQIDVLGPHERAPVSVLIKDPPAYDQMKFEVVPRKASYIPDMVTGLKVEAAAPTRAPFGHGWKLTGKVVHEGTEPAKFVKIVAMGLDEQGKLLGVHFTYADAQNLAPGQTARWSVPSAVFAADPAKFDFTVSATVAR